MFLVWRLGGASVAILFAHHTIPSVSALSRGSVRLGDQARRGVLRAITRNGVSRVSYAWREPALTQRLTAISQPSPRQTPLAMHLCVALRPHPHAQRRRDVDSTGIM